MKGVKCSLNTSNAFSVGKGFIGELLGGPRLNCSAAYALQLGAYKRKGNLSPFSITRQVLNEENRKNLEKKTGTTASQLSEL